MSDPQQPSSDNKSNNGYNRKRGIIASRAKLEHAMHASGLKTQASLADKIADLEELENSPRDLVNRVFRGIQVEHSTLERIATALNVEAYTLYLSSDEVDRLPLTAENNPAVSVVTETNSFTAVKKYISALLIFLITASAAVYFFSYNLQPTFDNSSPINHLSFTGDIPISLAIVNLSNFDSATFSDSLSQQVGEKFSISNSNIMDISPKMSPWEISSKLNVNFVLHVTTKNKGRYRALFIHLLSKNAKQLVYANVWPVATIGNKQGEIIFDVSKNIRSLFGFQTEQKSTASFKEEAIEAYLNGMDTADKALNLSYINQSLQSFERALHHSPGFIKAHSAKCAAMSNSYYLSKNIEYLKDAIVECEKFKDTDSPEHHYALGQLYRRKGDLENSKTEYLRAIEIEENYVDALLGLAQNKAAEGIKNQNGKLIQEALSLSIQALEISPDFWKIYHTKARFHYFLGNPAAAIETAEKGLALSPNLTVLNNLGTYHWCHGEMSRAKEIYEQMSTMKYVSPLVKFQLGSIYSFFSENEMAAKLMEQYIDEVKEDNGEVPVDGLLGLADVYNEMTENEKARETYQRTYEQLEKERINGQDNPTVQITLTYINIALATLGDTKLNPAEIDEYTEELASYEQQTSDPNMKLRILFAWMLIDKWVEAEKLYHQLSPVCKAFKEAPVFARFNR